MFKKVSAPLDEGHSVYCGQMNQHSKSSFRKTNLRYVFQTNDEKGNP